MAPALRCRWVSVRLERYRSSWGTIRFGLAKELVYVNPFRLRPHRKTRSKKSDVWEMGRIGE